MKGWKEDGEIFIAKLAKFQQNEIFCRDQVLHAASTLRSRLLQSIKFYIR